MQEIKTAPQGLKGILYDLLVLYTLYVVENDLAWYLANKVLSAEQGKQILDLSRLLCAKIAPHSLSLVAAFAIPDSISAAPISMDWVEYNRHDNNGEVNYATKLPTFFR